MYTRGLLILTLTTKIQTTRNSHSLNIQSIKYNLQNIRLPNGLTQARTDFMRLITLFPQGLLHIMEFDY